MTEQELISGCINNSRCAQRELFAVYYNEMVGLCMLYCKDNEDAAWVANQGFMDVFQHIEDFKGKSSLKTWIKKLMISRAINFYKQQKNIYDKQQPADYEQLSAMESHAADPDVMKKMEADEIISLIQLLPFNERSVFTMNIMEGYSHKEIAGIMGFAEGTSRWYLNSARKLLQEKLNNKKNQNCHEKVG